MADEPEGTPEVPDPSVGEPRLAGAALQSALKKERKAREDAEKRLKALEEAEQTRKDAELAEVERERKARERLESEFAEFRERTEGERLERDRIDRVRRAASDFEDPEIVVALLKGQGKLADIDSDSDADRVLKQLAKDAPKLLRQTDEEPSIFDRVLQNGQTPPKSTENGLNPVGETIIPFAQLNEMSAAELAAMKQTNYPLWERSMNALSGLDAYGKRVFTT